MFILWRSSLWNCNVIGTIRSVGHDPAFTECLSEQFAVITFIESQTLWPTTALTNLDAAYRFKDFALVVPVGFAQSEIERIAIGINHGVAFEATNTVFFLNSLLDLCPLF